MGSGPVVVCDTNVLVSALGWKGPERQIYLACRSGELRMATSPALLDELRRVLRYPKLRFSEDETARFEADILDHAQLVQATQALRAVPDDPDDDRVLECAVAADASYIVSGDRHLLALGNYGRITILTARVALAVLGLE